MHIATDILKTWCSKIYM